VACSEDVLGAFVALQAVHNLAEVVFGQVVEVHTGHTLDPSFVVQSSFASVSLVPEPFEEQAVFGIANIHVSFDA
jgi:hypothetical protein